MSSQLEEGGSSPIVRAAQLSEEQRRQIAVNRERAVKRRHDLSQPSGALQTLSEAGTQDSSAVSKVSNEEESRGCKECGNGSISTVHAASFGILVCKPCVRSGSYYEEISKSVLAEKYLLSDSSIKQLKFILKDNPRNKSWNQMRIYLRGDAEKAAIQQHGSLEEIENIVKKRKIMKFEKEMSENTFTFASLSEQHDETKALVVHTRAPLKRGGRKAEAKEKIMRLVQNLSEGDS